MTVSVADLDRLERECQRRINAIASAGRRRLATGDPEAPDPERVAQALLRLRALLEDVEELLRVEPGQRAA